MVVRVRPPAQQETPKTPQPPREPPAYLTKNKRPVFLILLGLPLFLVSSVALYRRVIEGQEKRVQLGEHTPDGGLRIFTPEEKAERDRQSWMTWLFGTEK